MRSPRPCRGRRCTGAPEGANRWPTRAREGLKIFSRKVDLCMPTGGKTCYDERRRTLDVASTLAEVLPEGP